MSSFSNALQVNVVTRFRRRHL